MKEIHFRLQYFFKQSFINLKTKNTPKINFDLRPHNSHNVGFPKDLTKVWHSLISYNFRIEHFCLFSEFRRKNYFNIFSVKK